MATEGELNATFSTKLNQFEKLSVSPSRITTFKCESILDTRLKMSEMNFCVLINVAIYVPLLFYRMQICLKFCKPNLVSIQLSFAFEGETK